MTRYCQIMTRFTEINMIRSAIAWESMIC